MLTKFSKEDLDAFKKQLHDLKRLPEVLIVDDSINDILLIQKAFKAANIECNLHCETKGKVAWDKIYKNDYDIIFLDMKLDGSFGGLEILQNMKSFGVKSRVVIITAYVTDNPELNDAIKLQPLVLLEKPPTAEHLKEIF